MEVAAICSHSLFCVLVWDSHLKGWSCGSLFWAGEWTPLQLVSTSLMYAVSLSSASVCISKSDGKVWGKGREDLSDDITTTIRTMSLTIWLFWHRSANLTHLTPTCWQAGSEKDAQTQCCQISSPRHMSLGGTSWSCALINCWASIGVDVMRCSPLLLLPIHLSLSQPTLPLGPFS